MLPYFSIVIPVFNRPELIINSLDSVKRQDHSLEVIIVDDSNDNTPDQIQNYIIRNNSMKIKHIKPNKRKGPSGARNIGIKNSKGKVIVFFDSDDELLPGALDDIKNAFKSKEKLSIYFGKIKRKSGLITNSDYYSSVTFGNYIDYVRTFRKQGEIFPAVRSSELIKKGGYFNENISGFENLLYLKILKNGGTFYRGLKPVRLYDDLGSDRLSILNPRNAKNMRDGYIIQLKDHGFSFLLHSQIDFAETLIKIIIYNRLLPRTRYWTIGNIIGIIVFPLPIWIIRRIISTYVYLRQKYQKIKT